EQALRIGGLGEGDRFVEAAARLGAIAPCVETSELEQRFRLHPRLVEVAAERERSRERCERLFVLPEKAVHGARLAQRVRLVVRVSELARERERLLREREPLRVFALRGVTIGGPEIGRAHV